MMTSLYFSPRIIYLNLLLELFGALQHQYDFSFFQVVSLFLTLCQSDSEYMAGQLSAFGYALTDNSEEADIWLINT